MKIIQTLLIGLLSTILGPGFANAQTTLVNGANLTDSLLLNTTNYYTFTVNAGDTINLRTGTTNFSTDLQLFSPTGVEVAFAHILGPDNSIEYPATNSGTFTVLVSSETSGGSGPYVLRLAQTPEPFVVPAGDEGGLMTNGANYYGAITLGDIDMWSFNANKGDTINLRVGATNFTALLELFGPTGAKLANNGILGPDNNLEYVATNSGTFTVLVSCETDGGTGTYVLTLAQTPEPFIVPAGDEGGLMTNGANYYGAITLGDIDLWSFNANKGDTINLRVGTTNFTALLELLGPTGAKLASNGILGPDNNIEYVATNSGTFTVLVSCETDGGTGTYVLRLAQTPEPFIVPAGDEGGPMVSGGNYYGAITLADLDMWSFTAYRGDSIILNVKTTNFTSYLELFDPTGKLLDYSGFSEGVSDKLTGSGTYTVLISDANTGESGTYGLTLTQSRAASMVPIGVLTNGANQTGTIPANTTNLYTFTANAGDNIILRLGTTNFYGEILLFEPDGTLNSSTAAITNNDVSIAGTLPVGGTYTVLVTSRLAGGSGTYVMRLAQTPEPFIVPTGDEGGALTGASNYNGTITLGDLDMWTFTAFKGTYVRLQLDTTNFYGEINLYKPDGSFWGNTANLTNKSFYIYGTTPSSGVYTVIVSSEFGSGAGTYTLTPNGLSGGLKISAPAISGNTLSFTGIGGSSNGTAVLYSTTNPATPFNLWTPVVTNSFDQFGVLTVTNSYNPALQKQGYFRLATH